MKRTVSTELHARQAYTLVEGLQQYFVRQLDLLSEKFGTGEAFMPVEWFREEGRFGGGVRFEATDERLFDRASVNVSQVHYESEPAKKLSSATAISTIIHPANPHAPSMHMHISWTEMKNGNGYWRIMADLNPAIEKSMDRERFMQMLRDAGGVHFEKGRAQGEKYFYIPALRCHRGVAHFYLEGFNSGEFERDLAYAKVFGEAVIDTYTGIVTQRLEENLPVDETARAVQLAYHTRYLFQVLTLDRGTTSGLLVHDQNDVGILGSLPSHVDVDLLLSWAEAVPSPQEKLVGSIAEILGDGGVAEVDSMKKKRLAEAVRSHYRKYPEALKLQASGEITPPTVENHS